MAAVLSFLTFVLVLLLIVLIFMRLFYRLGRYVFLSHSRPDLLLVRDLILFGSLGLVFSLSTLFRALGLDLRENVAWIVVTGLFVVGGLAFWAYVEYFRLERNGDP